MTFYGGLKKLLASTIPKLYNPGSRSTPFPMRLKFLTAFIVVSLFTGSAFAAVVVEKRSRQMPFVEVVDCQGVHSFIFRGPVGTSRRSIMVPPREYWTEHEAGIYSFLVRYQDGHVCSRLVTPEVFARYQVGDEFYAGGTVIERSQTEDSKSVQPAVTHHRHHTAQLRHHRNQSSHSVATHKRKQSSHRTAKHQAKHRSSRLASR
jgi:hypothetical protein